MIPSFEQYGLAAVQQAIDTVAANGGGRVEIPVGRHKTAGIELGNNVELHLAPGAILDFSDDPKDYPIIWTRWEGYEQNSYRPLIYAKGKNNVSVTGMGILEGNGQRWWDSFRAKTLQAARPCFICFEQCENIRLSDFRIMNSPAWTLHPLMSQNVLISGVSIKNPYNSPNTDGIDPESCQNVRILGCSIDVGDDCIAIKAGTEDGEQQIPCENITITGCTMLHGHGGVVLGSEMSGGIRRVTVTGCVFDGTDRGIRIKTRRKRYGAVEELTVSGIVMHDVSCPVVVNMMYYCGKDGKAPYVADPNPLPVEDSTPVIRHIQLSNIQVSKARSAAVCLYGLPESPIEDIRLNNMRIEMVEGEKEIPVMNARSFPMSRAGIYAENVRGLDLNGLVLSGVEGEERQFVNVTEI
ncbi:MAG: glycoside hydrolase family 28 protein [Clostridia bacterium]|nr:glycoside hydrolase family 28 protein [Clostridia bacterium]